MLLLDVNNFGPFSSDVWGNVADWAMVFVTAVTAIYLILTFWSQKRVQRLQQQITKIEAFKHIQDVMPVFTLRDADCKLIRSPHPNNPSVQVQEIERTMFIIELNENIAKRITLRIDHDRKWQFNHTDEDSKYALEKMHPKGNLTVDGSYKSDTPAELSYLGVQFWLRFTDIYDNEYSQLCYVTYSKGKFGYVSKPPVPTNPNYLGDTLAKLS